MFTNGCKLKCGQTDVTVTDALRSWRRHRGLLSLLLRCGGAVMVLLATQTLISSMNTLRIATRNSPLALWQAEDVKSRVEALGLGVSVELVIMTTRGDQLLDSPLAKIGG